MVYGVLYFVLFHITWCSEAEHSAMEFNKVFPSAVGGSEPQHGTAQEAAQSALTSTIVVGFGYSGRQPCFWSSSYLYSGLLPFQ